jgi:hypothetical protein
MTVASSPSPAPDVPASTGKAGRRCNSTSAPIVDFAFDPKGVLYLVDSHARVRRLGDDGFLRTFAGSSTPFTDGGNGAGGPATRASLLSPRQVIPLRDGSVRILDTPRLHSVAPDGTIRTLTGNFDFNATILLAPGGVPAAAARGRATLLDDSGMTTSTALFPSFAGNPIARSPLRTLSLARWRSQADRRRSTPSARRRRQHRGLRHLDRTDLQPGLSRLHRRRRRAGGSAVR